MNTDLECIMSSISLKAKRLSFKQPFSLARGQMYSIRTEMTIIGRLLA